MGLNYLPVMIKEPDFAYGCPHCGSKRIDPTDSHIIAYAVEYCCSNCKKIFVILRGRTYHKAVYYSVDTPMRINKSKLKKVKLIEHPFANIKEKEVS